MLKVYSLSKNASIADLRLGEKYLGRFTKGAVALSDNIRGTIEKSGKEKQELKEGTEVVVKVTKIILPNQVELELLTDKFTLAKETPSFDAISANHVGQKFSFFCKIDKVFHVQNLAIFNLFDGTAILSAKKFSRDSKMLYPNISEGDAVMANLLIVENKGILEAEIIELEKLSEKKAEDVLKKIEKASGVNISEVPHFLIESELLNRMEKMLLTAAALIKRALIESKPIIIRHHADCDGYTGAIAIERALLPLIIKQHKKDIAIRLYYKRSPSRAPFYEYSDALRDISFNLSDIERFAVKEPLILLIDCGSTFEDIQAIRHVKIYGAQVVVVDHHIPGEIIEGKSAVDEFIDAHVNPYFAGGDANLTAGMIAAELARFVNKDVKNIDFLPAISGISDKSSSAEFKKYCNLAEKSFAFDYLKEIAECVDFNAYYMGSIEGRNIVNDLLGQDLEKQKKLIEIIKQEVDERKKEILKAIEKFAEKEQLNKKILVKLNVADIGFRGEAPLPGKITGMTHDLFLSKHLAEGFGIITLGISSDYVVFRVSSNVNFSLINLMAQLKKKMPYAGIHGGGHEHAGTIKFFPIVKKELLEEIYSYIKNLKD